MVRLENDQNVRDDPENEGRRETPEPNGQPGDENPTETQKGPSRIGWGPSDETFVRQRRR
ncbi:hypothetical protein GCM10009668_14340 [Nocardioides dubius]|uniref:Uncharacterized protein n=1 Tax=Nocardioides dubius TaxID=317019 RepID=A0ABN1TQJ0_9ACTN